MADRPHAHQVVTIARYAHRFLIGELVGKRILLWGVAAFILALAFSFWHDGGYHTAPATRVPAQADKPSLAPAAPVASNAWGPSSEAVTTPTAAAAPTVTGTDPPAAIAPSIADADSGATLARRDRGAEHGSRSH